MAVESKVISMTMDREGKILHFRLTGKLEQEDYDIFVPEVESLIEQHGKIRVLVELLDFEGWSVSALWEDTKFAFHHFTDIERIAIVGAKRWEKGMALFCKPFTAAEIAYFDVSERDEALRWIAEGLAREAPAAG